MAEDEFDEENQDVDLDDIELEEEIALTSEQEQGLQLDDIYRQLENTFTMDEALLMEAVNYLWILWADFSVYINEPYVPMESEPTVIEPEFDSKTNTYEYVYPIYDYGDHLTTSRGKDMIKGSRSTGKLFMTIEKIITIMISRIRKHQQELGEEDQGDEGSSAQGPESRVAFAGCILGQRKAFESIINLKDNVIVTNFDPGAWGQRHLQNIKTIADRGYGFPKPAPRYRI